jgi:CDP-paratose 2-epimerase
VEENVRELKRRHGELVRVEVGDVRDEFAVRRAMASCTRVFHLAAQVAVTTSLHSPRDDHDINVQGTINVLEEARRLPTAPSVVFTSTNKVYGALDDVELHELDGRYAPADQRLRARGISERRPLHFCTPYGCSKGGADQYVCDWATSFGIASIVFRMSCIYGPHQFGTEDQGWVAHFMRAVLAGEPITIYGDGRQVRDILYVGDLVHALTLASEHAVALAGRAFNIGGGPDNDVSLRDVIALASALCGTAPSVSYEDWRTGDQRWYVSDTAAFRRATGWRPRTSPRQGLAALRQWLADAPVVEPATIR